MMSPLQLKLMKKLGKTPETTPRLVNTLYDKKDIILDYRYLKFCLEKGMKLKRISQVVEFEMENYMAETVDFNANERKISPTKLQQNNFKGLSNFLFGVSVSSTRKYMDAKMVLGKNDFKKQVSKLHFKSYSAFTEHTGLVTFHKRRFYAKNAVYLGFQILMLSKLYMLRYYYDTLKITLEKYAIKTDFAYQDTDSILAVHTWSEGPKSVFVPLRDLAEKFDTSNLDAQTHPWFNMEIEENERLRLLNLQKTNKKRLTCVAFDVPEDIMMFCALKPKVYSISLLSGREKCRIKGATQKFMDLKFVHYLNFLLGNEKYEMIYEMKSIRSKNHTVTLEQYKKKVTDKLDVKRFWLPCGKKSLAYGNKDIPVIKECWDVLEVMLDKVCANE